MLKPRKTISGLKGVLPDLLCPYGSGSLKRSPQVERFFLLEAYLTRAHDPATAPMKKGRARSSDRVRDPKP